MGPLDVSHYKEAVGHFPTGVAVVTGRAGDGPAGFTCQSFGSLSLEPMMVCFGANLEGRSWRSMRDAGAVGVNVLAESQEALARAFATPGIDKFAGVGWAPGPQGSPLLEGAIAHLEGRVVSSVVHGDHDLVVVAVDFAQCHPGRPLIYYRGGFTGLG